MSLKSRYQTTRLSIAELGDPYPVKLRLIDEIEWSVNTCEHYWDLEYRLELFLRSGVARAIINDLLK